jgi:hypothetical protein
MKSTYQSIAVVVAILGATLASPSLAEDAPPAVSAPNLKVDLSGGALSGGPALLAGFTGTVPLGHSFGVQLDGAIGGADDDMRGGFAGHVFYRDPRSYLLGGTAMWSSIAGPHSDAESQVRRIGAEAEIYLGNFSILPAAGIQNDHGDATGYGSLGGIYYAMPNLALSVSAAGFANSRSAQAGFEYQPSAERPLSFIVDVGMDNQGPAFVLAGFRYSFAAPSKSIQERDRYDDPANIVRYMNTVGASAFTAQPGHNPPPIASSGAGAS